MTHMSNEMTNDSNITTVGLLSAKVPIISILDNRLLLRHLSRRIISAPTDRAMRERR